MLRLWFSLFCFTLAAQSLDAGASKTVSNKSENNWIQDQDDETDTFAIPLDTSEAEEKIEEEAQEKLKKDRKH